MKDTNQPSSPSSKIMKYRKRPTEIEAVQYTEYGKLVTGMCNSRSCYAAGNTEPHVHTIHNNQIVNLEVGDFIIPEPDGEHYYPCKANIFHATYEPIEQSPSSKDELLKLLQDKSDQLDKEDKERRNPTAEQMSIKAGQSPSSYREGETKEDWTKVVDGHINVPDELMPLFNKVVTQMRFHTISGKSEVEAVAHIVWHAQQFFEEYRKGLSTSQGYSVEDMREAFYAGGDKVENEFINRESIGFDKWLEEYDKKAKPKITGK